MLLTAAVVLLGWQSSPTGLPPEDCKIELIAPKEVKDRKLRLDPGAQFEVAIRISSLDKDLCPELTHMTFLRDKDKAMAGDFSARPKFADDGVVEYRVMVTGPKKAGKYKLVVTPLSRKSVPGAPARDKYPSVDVTVE